MRIKGGKGKSVNKATQTPGAHLLPLRGPSGGGGGGQTLLSLAELAVGLPQSPLQLVDAGLVLLQHVFRLVQELLRPCGEEERTTDDRRQDAR